MKCFLKTCLLLIFLVALNSLYGQYGIGYGPADVTYDRRGNQIMSANGFSWTYQCWVADIWYTWGSLNGQFRHSYYKDVYRIFDISPRKGNLTLPDGAWTLENGACRNSDFSVVDLRNLVFLPYNDHQRYPAVISSGAFAGSHIGTLFLPNSFPQYEGAQYDYSISEGAFEDCVIDTLYVPNCIQELSKTFSGSCKTVKAVIVNEGVSGMDLRRLLSGCESVKSVTLPMGFKQIGEYGFSGVGALDTANLPDDLEKIGDYAFLNCDSLLSITVPAGVMAIGRGAFNGCKTLSKIVFSGDRPSVVDYLTDADKRSSLVVYVNVARNGWEDVKQSGTWLGHPVVCYREDEDWLYEEREGRITVTRCKKPRKSMTVPGTCDGLPVYAIGSNVFSASPDIMELTVSEGVEVIDTGAFENCTALSTIRLPDSLREIRANAFVGCNGVREINLPCGLEEFGLDALSAGMVAQCRTINDCLVFQNWVVGHNETNVQAVFPEGVQGVGRNALSGCMAIRDAALPASVVHIASGAFANDYYLETAELPDSVVTIGQGAYSNCTELVTLTFGAGVDKVGEGAFLNCISLKDVDLMSSHVRVLGPYSFSGPLQIRSVALPLSLEQVDASAFKGCQQITSVVVPAHVKPLKDLFPDSYRKITEVVIADGEKQIVPGMFADCVSLQRIVFPPSLEKVGEAAFQNCTALSELDIPDSIWSIGERAFSGCSNLQRVDLPVNLQEIASGLFEKCQSLKSLVIPAAVRRLGNNIYSGIQGRYSWEYVSELSVITFLGDAPEVEEESYAGVPSSVTTFVRKGSTGWFLTGSPTLPPNGWPAHHSHPIDYSSSEYSVTLDPNGADGEQTCLAFQFGEECVLPRCPFVRLGYEFTGWSKDPNGVALWQDQSHIDDLAACPGDVVVLYAIWKKNGGGEESPPIMILWRIVFDANGGECEDPVRVIEDGDLLGVLPTATRSKYKFNGWYTEVSGGIKVSTTTKVTGDATYYAQWVIDSSATCEVSFDPNGGICPESSRVVAVGKSLEAFPVCGRMGYKFDGWYTSAGGGVRVLESLPIANDVCLYAHWETINVPYELGKLYGTSESGAAETDWEAFKAYADSSHVPVVFIGGTSDCSYCRRIHDSVLGTDSWNLPCLMYYDYYTTIDTRSTKEYATWFKTFDWDQGTFPFAACYWNVDGKQKIESVFTLWAYDSMEKRFLYVDGDQIRKEKIGEKILDVFASQVGRVVVRFVSDVGECREESRSILWGNTVGDLPTLQANKYVFLGWFSEREGGKKITATTKATKSMTLYAHWSFTGTSTVGCALACGCDGMGSVSGGKAAKGGTKLTLKATAKKGYVFAGWYRDAAGENPVEGEMDYRSPSYSYVVGEDDAMFFAKFIPVDEDWVSVWCQSEDGYARGVEIAPLAVEVNSASLATVKVTGLPTGLKFTAKPLTLKATNNRAEVDLPANTIYGTPTKSGIYTATITATTAGKKSETYKVDFVVRGDGEYLVDVMGLDGADYPDNGSDAQHAIQWGKMSGYGVFASGKTATLKATANRGYVFAGWFSDVACVCAGGEEDDGCVYTPAEGSVDYRSTSFPVKVGNEDVLYFARFVRTEDDDKLWANVEDAYYLNGAWSHTLDIESLSLPTVTVKGLPSGLKFDAKTLTISGAPTKPGTYPITLSLKNKTITKARTQTFTLHVANIESPYLVGVDYSNDAYSYFVGSDVRFDLGSCVRGGYSISVVSGLPKGLSYNKATGMIEGCPTQDGAYTVSIALKNGRQSSNATLTMNVSWVEENFSLRLYRYVAVQESLSVRQYGDGLSFEKPQGALPSGINVSADAQRNVMTINGIPTSSGNFQVTYILNVQKSGKKIPCAKMVLQMEVVDPTQVGTGKDGAALNASCVKSRTLEGLMIFANDDELGADNAKRLLGTLRLTLPATGKASAKFLCESGTISFAAKSWDKIDLEDGSLETTLVGTTKNFRDWALNVTADSDGGVHLWMSSPSATYNTLDFGKTPWSKTHSAAAYSGYYTVTLAPATDDAGVPLVTGTGKTYAPVGSGYVTIKKMSSSQANSGTVTWAGVLPNGTSISGSGILAEMSEKTAWLPMVKFSTKDKFAGLVEVERGAAVAEPGVDCWESVSTPMLNEAIVRTWWRHTENSKNTDKNEFAVRYEPYGGIYDSTYDLNCCCEMMSRPTTMPITVDVPASFLSDYYGAFGAVEPINVTIGTHSVSRADSTGGGNKITLSYNKSTGIVSGKFDLHYTDAKTLADEKLTATYGGVIQLGCGDKCGYGVSLPFVKGFWCVADKIGYQKDDVSGEFKKWLSSVKRGGAFTIELVE